MKKTLLIIFLFLNSTTAFCVKWTITNNMNMQFTPDSITIHLGDTVRFFIGNTHYVVEVSQSNWLTANDSASVVALPGGFSTPYSGGFVYPPLLGTGVHYYTCPPHTDFGMKGRIFVINTSGINAFNFNANLFHVFPNPVSENLNVSYSLKQKMQVEIKLYDVTGRLSAVLFSQTKTAGDYIQTFEMGPNRFKNGIYFIELVADKNKSIQKIFIE